MTIVAEKKLSWCIYMLPFYDIMKALKGVNTKIVCKFKQDFTG